MEHALNCETEMLDITQVLAKPNEKFTFAFEFEPQAEWIGNNPYKFCGDGQFVGKIWFADKVLLEGSIIIPTNFVCSRCGAGFEENLFVPVHEELSEFEDDEHFSLDGNKVNLFKIVEQVVATNIPSQALCNENCLGVCPVCGTNLNEGKCNCDRKLRGNNPFASLMDKFN